MTSVASMPNPHCLSQSGGSSSIIHGPSASTSHHLRQGSSIGSRSNSTFTDLASTTKSMLFAQFGSQSLDVASDQSSRMSITDHSDASTKSGRSRHPRHRPVIGFEEYDEVFEIPHLNDLSQEEIDSVWTGRHGLRTIRQRCIEIVDRIQSGERGLYIRGLEHYVDPESSRSRETKRMRAELLRYVQELEDMKGTQLPELFASLYSKMSERSQLLAHRRGLKDARICETVNGLRKSPKE
mmetsp:Transcript_22961/g.65061  ORF Transcript_22961/g.65061 Transcript_22961/m.65061 type:complete len:239 (+) Transcript_22961:132-848(+)|eukprot:CAMPEP_0119568872 /NCGR_PEP_ID=MMETSP1352-20130426/40052_1 /TAXON_ID=265584 /ORGANISM="Stauroneis constricta, Strain CCMP1120" /LENGTH=238 /DNA_ID=CAMNT_0007618335 /DNA_START=113 /DNA_END=829 /DNA_ORIENTATION=-